MMLGRAKMCIGAVQEFVDNIFGDGQDLTEIPFHAEFDDFMSAGVNIGGTNYVIEGESLTVTGHVEPFTVETTLEFMGLNIPLINFNVGSGPKGPPKDSNEVN
jgi:hypothetical protein